MNRRSVDQLFYGYPPKLGSINTVILPFLSPSQSLFFYLRFTCPHISPINNLPVQIACILIFCVYPQYVIFRDSINKIYCRHTVKISSVVL